MGRDENVEPGQGGNAGREALRRRIHELLSVAMPGDRASRWIDYGLIALIVGNIAAVMLESVDSIHERFETGFFYFELISVVLFSLEYVLRVWSCVEDEKYRGMDSAKARFRFAISLGAITDLAAFLPFYLLAFVNIDLRFLRVLRLRRGFKLTRYSPSINLVLGVIKAEARAFLAILFLLMLFVILASSFIYLFENEKQPEIFGTIPDAMEWSVRTLTTVGGMEAGPRTVVGRIFGFLMSVVGILIIAVVTGLLASSFIVTRQKRREDFRWAVEDLMVDGELPEETASRVEHLRRHFGFSKRDAEELIGEVKHEESERREDIDEMIAQLAMCPHCGKKIGAGDAAK